MKRRVPFQTFLARTKRNANFKFDKAIRGGSIVEMEVLFDRE